jgi:hypothetical protein
MLLIIAEGALFAQKKSDAKLNNVRAVTEYKQDLEKKGPQLKEAYTLYDKSGNILEEIEYDSEGKVKIHFKYQYDANNNKIKEIEISPAGKTIRVHEYKYNSNNLRTERNTYDGAGKLKSKRTFQYDYQN